MDRRNYAFILILLLASSPAIYSAYYAWATPSPSIGRTVTPGSIGPCTWFISLDGTTPVAQAMIGGLSVSPGDNVVGTTGQDMAVFLSTYAVSGNNLCFSGQTFTFSSALTMNNVVGMKWQGSGSGSTVFQQASGTNVPQWMFRITQTSTDIMIKGITFDFNAAGQGAYTCPNAGWIFAIDHQPSTSVTVQRITLQNNDFRNSACQAIELLAQDVIVTGNQFRGVHQGMFVTGVLTQRVTISNNVFIVTGTFGANVGCVDLEDRVQNITISANVCKGAGVGNGFGLAPANMTTIIGNSIEGFQVGISVSIALGNVFNSFVGNVITDNLNNGIKIASSSQSGTVISGNVLRNNGGGPTDATQIFIISSGSDLVINSNSLIDTRSGAARVQFGIYVQSTNQVVIDGNLIDGFRSQGIRIEDANDVIITSNQVISSGVTGLLVTGTSVNAIVTSNNFRQSGTLSLVTGCCTVYNNLGYVTENWGATSVADGGTISHGLAGTPDTVQCTTSITDEFCSVTALAATTFTVTITKHDGTAGTTQTIYWYAVFIP